MNYPDRYAYDDKFINDMCEMFDGERVDDTILDRSKVTFKTEKLIFDSRYITKYGFFETVYQIGFTPEILSVCGNDRKHALLCLPQTATMTTMRKAIQK